MISKSFKNNLFNNKKPFPTLNIELNIKISKKVTQNALNSLQKIEK